jgi:hypothetical protein
MDTKPLLDRARDIGELITSLTTSLDIFCAEQTKLGDERDALKRECYNVRGNLAETSAALDIARRERDAAAEELKRWKKKALTAEEISEARRVRIEELQNGYLRGVLNGAPVYFGIPPKPPSGTPSSGTGPSWPPGMFVDFGVAWREGESS